MSKLLLGEGESPPPLLNSVCVAVETLEVVDEAAAAGAWSPPSTLLLPLHDAEEVVVVAEAVLLLLKDVAVVLEAELLVQLFAPPTR